MTGAKLRIGLLNDDTHVSAEVADLIRWAMSRDDLEVSHLLLHPAPRAAGAESLPGKARHVLAKHGLVGTASRLTFRLLAALENSVLRALGGGLTTVDVSDVIPNHLRLHPDVSPSGFVYRFPSEDIASIKGAEIDVLIRCGTGILRGDILTATRFGILSFHHGDNLINRGGPPGFWEVQDRRPSTGFVIQQLTDELDGGRVLRRGNYPTQLYYAANRESIVRNSAHHLRNILANLAKEGQLPEAIAPLPYSGPLLRTPGFRDQARYVAKQLSMLLSRGGRKLTGQRSHWTVGYVWAPWRQAVLRRGRELPAPPGTFLADPFVIERGGNHFCFVEEYSYEKKKAHISVFRLGESEAERLGIALDEPFHLSFPSLFTYQGDLFMCPETLEASDVRIYRCTQFPLRWELAGVALANIRACDTLIFPHEDRWWLLTTVDMEGSSTPSELFAYSAESPLGGWRAHPLNPLRVDTDSARNAGLLTEGADLYRVAQRQGFARYGAGASIRRIVRLDDTGLHEEIIGHIRPDFHPDIHGIHHLHATRTVTVFDYVRHRRPR